METHDHCAGCVNSKRCRKLSSNRGCPFARCHLDCGSTYHACKEDEHRLLCPKEKVKCINSVYGCPLVLERERRGQHLQHCPASVVHCTMTYDHDPVPLVDNVPATITDSCDAGIEKTFSCTKKEPFDSSEEKEAALNVSTLCDIAASATTMFNMHVNTRNCAAVRGDWQKWKTFKPFDLNPKQPYTFICARDLKRSEFAWHFRNVHSDIQSCLYGWVEQWCPLAQYGCIYTRRRLTPCLPSCERMQGEFSTPQVVFSQDLEAFGVKHHSSSHNSKAVKHEYTNGTTTEEESRAGPEDTFSKLPNEVLFVIAGHLDGYSLNHLSMTSKRMRSICHALLPAKGIVLPLWERRSHLKNGWSVTGYRWLFSVACSPIPRWRMSDLPHMSEHMRHCPHLRAQTKEKDGTTTSVQVMGPFVQEFSTRQSQGEGGLINQLSQSLKAKLLQREQPLPKID